MKPLLTLVIAVSLSGCRSEVVDVESVSNPVPEAETHSHGYETADGTVVKYGDIETDGAASDGGGYGDYEDRAVAR